MTWMSTRNPEYKQMDTCYIVGFECIVAVNSMVDRTHFCQNPYDIIYIII